MCRLLSVGVCQTKSAENCCRQLDTKKLSKGPVAATTTDSTFPDRLQREDEDRKKEKKENNKGPWKLFHRSPCPPPCFHNVR